MFFDSIKMLNGKSNKIVNIIYKAIYNLSCLPLFIAKNSPAENNPHPIHTNIN